MSNEENEVQPEKQVQSDEPMNLADRAAHYARPGTYRNPKTGKQVTPNSGTAKQTRRLRHKENHAIAIQVRAAEEKVAKLRGAAKNSAKKTLDRLKVAFN